MPFDATDFQPAKVDPKSLTNPRDRLVYLRDFLMGLPAGTFDMDRPGFDLRDGAAESPHSCGTAACIGGWARVLFSPEAGTLCAVGAEVLGLDISLANRLFYPFGVQMSDGGDAIHLTDQARAASVLTHLLETGEVDWSVA